MKRRFLVAMVMVATVMAGSSEVKASAQHGPRECTGTDIETGETCSPNDEICYGAVSGDMNDAMREALKAAIVRAVGAKFSFGIDIETGEIFSTDETITASCDANDEKLNVIKVSKKIRG